MHKENTEAPGVWTKVLLFIWDSPELKFCLKLSGSTISNIVGIDTIIMLYLKMIVFFKRNTHLKLNCVSHFFFHTLLSTWRPLFNRKKPRSSPIPSQYIQARLVSPSTWMKDVMNRLSPPPQYKWVALSRLRKMWRTAHTTPLGYLNLPPLGKRGICSVKVRWDWCIWFNTCCPYNVFYQLSNLNKVKDFNFFFFSIFWMSLIVITA